MSFRRAGAAVNALPRWNPGTILCAARKDSFASRTQSTQLSHDARACNAEFKKQAFLPKGLGSPTGFINQPSTIKACCFVDCFPLSAK